MRSTDAMERNTAGRSSRIGTPVLLAGSENPSLSNA